MDTTQKGQEFQLTVNQLRATTEYSKNDSMLRCLIKSQMAEAPQQWEDHSYDVRRFIGSLSSLKATLTPSPTSVKASRGTISSSAVQLMECNGWIKSPRVSEEMSEQDAQVIHPIRMFSRLW